MSDEIDVRDGTVFFGKQAVADMRSNVPASLAEAFVRFAEELQTPDEEEREDRIAELEEQVEELEEQIKRIREICDE